MNKHEFFLTLEACILSFEGCDFNAMTLDYGINKDLVKIGVKFSDFFKTFELNPKIKNAN